ncbi:TPA: MerR family DNA-binding transcriptional regulator [Morganella morganii]|nr:MerR family DNA-binding transcriptional regulator [Morganella morganii subsp. morganii]HDU8493897.1 MerR family DNA-binding transcriptional regulator [Morganella morganii]
MLLQVGEIAEKTGLTVRTLHHYEAIGLLQPVSRTGAGYRLYNADNIEPIGQLWFPEIHFLAVAVSSRRTLISSRCLPPR